MNKIKKRNLVIICLCGVLLCMAIGYAAFQTVLNINGVTTITTKWNVLITNIESKDIVGGAYNIEEPTHTELEATFKTGLTKPGDSITYDITVENQGSFDAYLNKITINKTKENEAILFESSGLSERDILHPKDIKVLTIVVTFNNDITDEPEDKNADFTVDLDFSQDPSEKPAESELVWQCPEEYTSTDEAGPDMRCTKEVEGEVNVCSDRCAVWSPVYTEIPKDGKCRRQSEPLSWECPDGTHQISGGDGDNKYVGCATGNWGSYTWEGHATKVDCGTNGIRIDYSGWVSICVTTDGCTNVYSCESGYSKSGSGTDTKCIKTEEASPQQVTTYTCPDGYHLQDQTCYKD